MRELQKRWCCQPLWVRLTLAVYLLGFLVGCRTHIADVARDGIHAYAMFPQVPLQVFFVGLVVLDPLVVVLVALVRREGVWLAGAVMVVDLSANWWGNRHWLRDDPGQLMRLLPLTVFGVFVFASWLPLRRAVIQALLGPTLVRDSRH
ncbi:MULTISPECIES: hypothetical protein [unclassified Streptomyces]|uniref:hypothetical protein n=1 Tax=unclassified Streptomyces TaxID=2593676 RepID=UPI002E194FB8|nr:MULTISPECIES: hypothetical protein [unclassified Streptomyces]